MRAALAGLLAIVVAATGAATSVEARAKSAVLVLDVNSGRVLREKAADAPRYPASLAKLMTLYLVFERMEQGTLRPETKIRMSAIAAAAPPSKLDLEAGEEITLIEAVKALITKSANDVAVAVAEHIAGSEEKFAKLMTEKARQLGMAATTFRNASGLPDDEQVTTARDMVTLALHLQDDFPRQYPLFATRTFTYKDETFRNHNTLLFNYPGTDGLKTGYTRASGFNLAASVRRGRRHVIGIVFGGTTASARNAAMRTYLNIALVKASTVKTRKPAPRAPHIARAKPPSQAWVARVPTPRRITRVVPEPIAAAALPPDQAVPHAEAAASPVVMMARVRPVLIAPDAAAEPGRAANPNSIEALLEARAGTSPRQGSEALSGRSALSSPPPTLDAQAASPDRTAPAAAGGFQVQVGAYQSADEAQRQLALVAERAFSLVGRRNGVTQQVKLGGKLYYRARYVGFEARGAAEQACTQLKRISIDCFALEAD
jgi:D-alanyl-D-alanine carboxypeptidase